MLTLLGNRTPMCDSLDRRSFLRIGGLALGGMTLPQVLQAEQAAGVNANGKGIIMIFLPGGPSHQDMWDVKMDAPSEVRGEFTPIQTKVPGVEIALFGWSIFIAETIRQNDHACRYAADQILDDFARP